LFNIRCSVRAKPDRLAEYGLERLDLAARGPEFQLCVAGRAHVDDEVIPAVVDLDPADALGMAAVEPFGQAENCGERADHPAKPWPEGAELLVRLLRRRVPVVPGQQRDDLGLVRIESPQVAVLDQVIRVLVVPRVADVQADVVKERPVFEPFPLAVRHRVDRSRLIEDRHREPRDVVRVLRPVTAALGQLDGAPSPDVRISIRLRNVLAVAPDVVEHESFTQRQVAQGQLGRAESLNDRVQHHGAGDDEIHASRVEPGKLQALGDVEPDDLLAQTMQLLG
jgi:hypothetical protein